MRKRKSNKLFWILPVLPLTFMLAVACARSPLFSMQLPTAQPDCGYVQNVYNQRISWKGATPIMLYLHESFPQEYLPALQAAIKVWETALGRPLFQVSSQIITGPANPQQDGMSVIYYMNTWEPNLANEQARTSVYWLGDQIQEADMRIDAANFTFYTDSTTNPSSVNMESLLLHELGHVLGLKHRDGIGSVMATYLSADTVRDVLGSPDHQALACEY